MTMQSLIVALIVPFVTGVLLSLILDKLLLRGQPTLKHGIAFCVIWIIFFPMWPIWYLPKFILISGFTPLGIYLLTGLIGATALDIGYLLSYRFRNAPPEKKKRAYAPLPKLEMVVTIIGTGVLTFLILIDILHTF